MDVIDFATAMNILNVIFLLVLTSIYLKNCKKIKCSFSIGLVFFALFFLLHNLLAIYFHVSMIEYYSKEVAQFELLLNSIQTLGLGTLVYVTLKPV